MSLRQIAWRTAEERADAWLKRQTCCLDKVGGAAECGCAAMAERLFPTEYAEVTATVTPAVAHGQSYDLVVGVDLGYVNDRCTIVTVAAEPGGLVVTDAVRLPTVADMQAVDGYFATVFASLRQVLDDVLAVTAGRVAAVVDVTGNTASVELLRAAAKGLPRRCEVLPVSITGGEREGRSKADERVMLPKNPAVENLSAMLGRRRADDGPWLRIDPDCEDRAELLRQLGEFTASTTAAGNTTYAAAGSGHDDLAMALVTAVFPFRGRRARVHNPANYDRARAAAKTVLRDRKIG